MSLQRILCIQWYDDLSYEQKDFISKRLFSGNMFPSNRDIEKAYVEIVVLGKHEKEFKNI